MKIDDYICNVQNTCPASNRLLPDAVLIKTTLGKRLVFTGW